MTTEHCNTAHCDGDNLKRIRCCALALQQHSCAAGRLSCIQTVAELLSHIYAMLHNALRNVLGGYAVVSVTLVGVT
jgi:hypothetical protein